MGSSVIVASQKATESFSKLLLLFHSAELYRPDHIGSLVLFVLPMLFDIIG